MHYSHGLFSCVELHFGLLSAVEKLMYLQDCGFGEMFVTISSMLALVRPLPSVSFHVHLQDVSTKKRFSVHNLQTLSPFYCHSVLFSVVKKSLCTILHFLMTIG